MEEHLLPKAEPNFFNFPEMSSSTLGKRSDEFLHNCTHFHFDQFLNPNFGSNVTSPWWDNAKR